MYYEKINQRIKYVLLEWVAESEIMHGWARISYHKSDRYGKCLCTDHHGCDSNSWLNGKLVD